MQQRRDENETHRLGTRGMFMTIAQLSHDLQIKRSTLYAWVSQRKVPFLKVNGCIRFRQDEIDAWLESLRSEQPKPAPQLQSHRGHSDVKQLIAEVIEQAYTSDSGKPGRAKARKEE